jgi:ABC-2 type transport system permease protein
MSGNRLSAWRREASLLRRDRSLLAWLWVMLLLTSLALLAGQQEVQTQRQTLAQLQAADLAERQQVLAQQSDWGDAAYHSFHLTYDPPGPLAFVALGLRDTLPWKHRLRLLALEGQIYERDISNPEFALIGRFDLARLASLILPLVLILLLHDLHARERAAGRYYLLVATAASPWRLWCLRAGLRSGALLLAMALPLMVAAVLWSVPWLGLLQVLLGLLAYGAFWTLLLLLLSAWRQTAEVILAAALGLWLLLALLLPGLLRLAIDQHLPLPSGGAIALAQREAVNDAWDLPKATSMDAFVARHPEWAAYSQIERPFEWTWYYAFQQAGDQQVEPLVRAYRAGREQRDQLAEQLSWLAPPAKFERYLKRLAGTDLRQHLAYEDRLRAFHGQLRHYHYPKLFLRQPYTPAATADMPRFTPGPG